MPVEPPPPDDWGIVDAWETAADGFVKVAGGAFVGIAAVAPVVGPLVLAFIAWRLLRRRACRGEPLPIVATEGTDAGTKS